MWAKVTFFSALVAAAELVVDMDDVGTRFVKLVSAESAPCLCDVTESMLVLLLHAALAAAAAADVDG